MENIIISCLHRFLDFFLNREGQNWPFYDFIKIGKNRKFEGWGSLEMNNFDLGVYTLGVYSRGQRILDAAEQTPVPRKIIEDPSTFRCSGNL